MRKFLALMAVVLLVSSTGIAFAMPTTDVPSLHKVNQGPQPGAMFNSADLQGAAKVDTIFWGWYEDRYTGTDSAAKYARRGETWTFDHPLMKTGDPLEGWTSEDLTQNAAVYWRPMTSALWTAEANGTATWPQMVGNGMLICGTTLQQANLLSYLNGLGYGPTWGQQVVSPTLQYDGTGDVTLSMKWFSQAEVGYDWLKVYLEVDEPPFYKKLLLNGPNGWDGALNQVNVVNGVITPTDYTLALTQLMFGNGNIASHFRIIVEFKSDGGVSDYDGPLDTMYGACGIDEVSLTTNLIDNAAYNFDDGTLMGWTAEALQGIGAFMGRANRELDYIVGDPCACALTGGVLEMHSDNPNDRHPNGQEEALSSPIVDRKGDIGNPAYLAYNRIMAEWDQYADMPQANGVFYRPGWKYYPYSPPALPNLTIWSPRIGQDTWHYVGDVAICYGTRAIGTDWGLPTNAQKVKFVYEINSNCDSFGITNCTGVTNFSPIIDNITVRTVGFVDAPVALFEPGTRFQDGFGMGSLGVLSTTDAGNADIVYNLRMGSDPGVATRLGDSLMITGPTPTSLATKWEAKMWFRLRRVGPGQTSNATYNIWKPAMGANVDYPNFAWGYMDSVETGGGPALRDKFCSYFRENDPKFSWGPDTGDKAPGNEILPDGCFTPGTKIEYFITTNWIPSPTAYYFYPDTVGGLFFEFEILPSFRNVDATQKFPCFLFVDAVDNGNSAPSQVLVQAALNEVLNNNSPVIPAEPTTWDRFDYMDVTSNWHGTSYREPYGNSGATMCQLLGYKTILVSLGDASGGAMWPRCWQGFDEWLKATVGDGNVNRQGFIVDGTASGYIVPEVMLNGTMGATRTAIAYNGVNPPANEVNCPRIVPVGSNFDPGIATNAYGNWCPDKERFNVLGTTGSGVGNKQFQNPNTLALTSFAQVINDKLGAPYNYRSVIDCFSYMRIFPASAGACIVPTDADIVTAAKTELKNAINWTMGWGLTDKAVVPLCINTCTDLTDVPDEEGAGGLVTRLYQNHPNPFNPRTVIKFSLAADGPTKLIIYDVNGRRIRTLVNELQKAGPHEAVWDGTDDAGRTVTSGVYWSQLQAGSYSSNKKMVVLK